MKIILFGSIILLMLGLRKIRKQLQYLDYSEHGLARKSAIWDVTLIQKEQNAKEGSTN